MSREVNKRAATAATFVEHYFPFIEDPYRFEILIKIIYTMNCLDDHMENKSHLLLDPDKKDRVLEDLLRDCREYYEIVDRLEKGVSVSMNNWRVYIVGFYIANEEVYKNLNQVQKTRFTYLTRNLAGGQVNEINFRLSGKYYDTFEEYCKVIRIHFKLS